MSVTLINNDTDFRSAITDNEAILVDFYADWCNPCKQLSPKLFVLAEQFPKVKIIKINTDTLPDIQDEFQVSSLPTLKLFVRGEVAKTIVGANVDKIRAALEEVYQVENWTDKSTSAPAAPAAPAADTTTTSDAAATPAVSAEAPKAVTDGNVVEITSEADFGVISQRPCVIDFYAQWCGPCKLLAPFYKGLAQKYPTVNFYKIDFDEFSDLADSLEVSSLPTIVFFNNGKKVHTHIGANKDKILAAFETHFGPPQ